ncbi:MAG: 2-octaprenyl-6-methoxyphenyl hydroxylase [Gammaproteobacteria bacterium]|nr:2-octaprenyl-6-methoxyphenyl hydroxylase [Gammaproteobacteria bacterium]
MATNRKYDHDIVIAGGGMVGTSLALALAPLGMRVAVVEAVPRSDHAQPSFDDRSTALSRSSQRMFEAMGLWPEIVAAATPIHHIHVSDKGRFGFSHIDAQEQNVEALGYVVINRVLGEVLHRALLQLDGTEWLCPARITSVELGDERVTSTLQGQNGQPALTSRLLVAADGARSAVRDMIGISARHVDYAQHAIVGNLLPEKAIANRAFERFTDDGPLALLPVADNRAAFIWTLPPQRAQEIMALDDSAFTAAISRAFGSRLGRFSKVGKRAAYPLGLSKANGLVSRRSVLVGNAAHGLHPVAAQGFNLGLRDVASLCDCIADARMASGIADPGSQAVLDEYLNWRRADQAKLVHFTDGLVRLFGQRSRPVRILRDIGMLSFDIVPGVRRLFARHTMGLAGRLPRLSRGVPLE